MKQELNLIAKYIPVILKPDLRGSKFVEVSGESKIVTIIAVIPNNQQQSEFIAVDSDGKFLEDSIDKFTYISQKEE